jgi:predicted transcriptional regulator
MKVLLSIKPEFADKIFKGEKKFEFRRTIFKNEAVKTVLVYASSPIQKVIGEFEIETILKNDPENLWNLTSDFAGISRDYFMKYFANKDFGFAIKIKKVRKYKVPKCIKKDFNSFPPQSFLYIH